MKVGDRVEALSGRLGVITGIYESIAGHDCAHVRLDCGTGGSFRLSDLRLVGPRPAPLPLPRPAKYDDTKRRWDMLLVDCDRSVDEVMKVLEFGLTKYGEGTTWKTVEPRRYKRAAIRHLIASLRGEAVNAEDGDTQHLAQAITCLLFALQNELDPSQQVTK